jgi:hypothetical protein
VKPVLAVLPELVDARAEHVAAPVGRRLELLADAAAEPLDRGLEHVSGLHDLALMRHGRRETRSEGTSSEVPVRLLHVEAFDVALDPHLAAQLIPVEEQRRPRILRQLAAFTALEAGVEDEPALAEVLQQHHPSRRGADRSRRGERHRLGDTQIRLLGLGEPQAELAQRVEIGVLLEQLHHANVTLLFTYPGGPTASVV